MSLLRPSKKVFLQVFWNGVDTSIPSLFLFTDTKRYVFNCGEGLQRVFTQRKIKLSKLNTFFMTRNQWSHMGGLPGFGMTLRDMKNDTPFKERIRKTVSVGTEVASGSTSIDKNIGENDIQVCNEIIDDEQSPALSVAEDSEADPSVDKNNESRDATKKIKIYAPQGMKNIISATKNFLRFDDEGVSFEVTEHLWKDRFELQEYIDDEFTVQSIPVYNTTQNKQRSPKPSKHNDIIDITPHFQPSALCYACHLKPLPGKFNVKNAKKLGVPKGPLFGKLQRGESVVLDDGTEVTPQEVLGPPITGPCFLIIDCPTVLYIENLIENLNLRKYLSEEKRADLVVHLSPVEVCEDVMYIEWTKRFPKFTKHIYLNKLLQESVVFESQHCLQIMLNHINSKIFPLTEEHKTMKDTKDFTGGDSLSNFVKINLRELCDNTSKVFDNSEVKPQVDRSELLCRVNKALNKVGDDIVLTNSDCNIKDVEVNNVQGKRHSNDDIDSIPNKKGNFNDDVNMIGIDTKRDSSSQKYPKVICLGTGSCLPSKYRNVSGTLVFLSENNAVLLDCGENTYGELLRHYGDNVNDILSKIKFIFISHMHADHHLGLITLITKSNALQKHTDNSFIIMAPNLLCQWLTKYADACESLKFKFVNFKNAYSGVSILPNLHVQPVKVDHPGIAHGLVLMYNDSIKITYSGDTMPCSALIDAGKNSNLLIHEATLEDDMIEDARDRKHSTTTQAIEVGQKMNADHILLTHFSQRYPKIPILKQVSCQTAYAFDHMEVTLDDIPNFCKLVPTLDALFAQEDDDI